MDIGTGKQPINSTVKVEKFVDHWSFDGVNVWGYDLAKPDDYFSAVDFALFAREKTKELLEKNKHVFIVGGTGFYIDVYTGDVVVNKTKPDFELREKLEKMTLLDLQKQLMSLNPLEYKKIDRENNVRLIRAIEKEIGKEKNTTPLPSPPKNIEFEFIGLVADRETLYNRSDLWTETVWENGLVDETKDLINKGFENSPKLHGLVYKSVVAYITGDLSENEAIARIKFDIHAYIRRQQTYFKRNTKIKWLDITKDGLYESVYNLING